ncbi:MAG: hypothetical protein HYT94_05630 [Parcubacteria group bacterium]|nr:hypothetical protein [Parcubacteria group bacterium]
MDNQNMSQNTTPQVTPTPTTPPSAPIPSEGEETKSVGALIGSIIIVIILIIGGFYLWSTKVAPVAEPTMMEQGMPVMDGSANEMTVEEQALNQPDPMLSQMAAVGASDEVSAIDADLKATNLDGMDAELQ